MQFSHPKDLEVDRHTLGKMKVRQVRLDLKNSELSIRLFEIRQVCLILLLCLVVMALAMPEPDPHRPHRRRYSTRNRYYGGGRSYGYGGYRSSSYKSYRPIKYYKPSYSYGGYGSGCYGRGCGGGYGYGHH